MKTTTKMKMTLKNENYPKNEDNHIKEDHHQKLRQPQKSRETKKITIRSQVAACVPGINRTLNLDFILILLIQINNKNIDSKK